MTDGSLPTVRALDELWAEISTRPLWAPPNFWRYLRLRWRMRLGLLDPRRVRVLAPAGKVNDCSSCLEHCCVGRRSTVLLRLRDLAALVDIGRDDLVAQEKPDFTAEELAARPALRRQVASDSWRIFPALRQTRFHACAALGVDGRCTLYPHWPLSCARFPYALHADDREVFYSPRCDSFWIRPDACEHARAMTVAAVAGYNERIKDLVLLAYAPLRLEALGLVRFLRV